jgi:hypothetical protein
MFAFTLSFLVYWLAFFEPFFVYWLAFFVVCYITTEMFADQLYDEVPKFIGFRVAAGSLILALLAAWLHPSFETLFTANLAWTALQAIAWVAVYILLFQFHPWHGLAIGLITMLLIPGVATMGVDNLMTPTPVVAPIHAKGAPPVRKSLNPTEPPPKPPEPAKK